MEDVLEVYLRPYDAARPVVCFDETSTQLLEHTRMPLPARPGDLAHVDDEDKRCGTANIFAAVEPLTGWCLVQATDRRTNLDTAKHLRRISEAFPNATAITLVMDNLSAHALSCLYEAFPPAEARRLTERFEVHHTPKHASWLNIAEILLLLARQATPRPADRHHRPAQGGPVGLESCPGHRQGEVAVHDLRRQSQAHRLCPSLP